MLVGDTCPLQSSLTKPPLLQSPPTCSVLVDRNNTTMLDLVKELALQNASNSIPQGNDVFFQLSFKVEGWSIS